MAIQRQSRSQGRFSRTFSTAISNISYNPLEETMDITFHNPSIGTWRYYDVSPLDAAGFIESSSRGSYFNQFIRGRYEYERIS